MSAFEVTEHHRTGDAICGHVYAERTGKTYEFTAFHNGNVMLARGMRAVPANHLRDVRHAVREHFKAPEMVKQPAQQAQAQGWSACPAPVAASEPFRGFAGAVHDFSVPMRERLASRKHVGPYIWKPTPANSDRGFYMEGGSGLACARHGAGFTLRIEASKRSYSFDDFGGDFTGIVLRLPKGRGFLTGATMGAGMSSFFEPGIWQDERDAMRAADDIAHRVAEQKRDYQEANSAGARYVEAGEEYRTARRLFLTTAKALRRSLAESLSDAALEALGALIRDIVKVRHRIAGERERLARDFMNTDGFRDAIA